MTAPTCRYCSAALEHVFADLGISPLANNHLPPERVDTRWNLREEIARRLGHVREWGGRFAVRTPELRLVE